jgi:hypothetical protein
MFAAVALAFFAVEPSAGAVTLGSSNNSSVSVDYGGSIDLTASGSGPFIGYAGVNISGLGVAVAIPRNSTITVGPLNNSGNNVLTWQAYCNVLGKIVKCTPPAAVHSMTVIVGDAPPPPPPATSSTPAPPDSSTPGGPGSSSAGSSSPGSPPSSGASSSPGSTPSGGGSSPGSKPSTGAGGITIGPPEIHPSNNGNIPLGFGPPVDPNAPTPSIPNPIGSGVGVVPTGVANTGAPSSGSSTQTLVELANTTPKPKSRPTSLAIVSIGLLAIVASVYAYRRLGEQAQRPAH